MSDLIIKGMDMPESCRHCRFCVAEDTNDDYSPYYCVINPYLRWSTSVDIPDYVSLGCNSFEIPTPHGRLIDADAHIQSLKENQCGERCRKNHDCVNCGIGMYIRIVENEPTILEAEE